MLHPIGHRLLIQPDAPPEQTDSGLVLPQDRDHVPVSGVVVAVGDGPATHQKIRSACIARCIGIVEELQDIGVRDLDSVVVELRRYKNQVERFEGTVAVGDRVAYPVEAGLRLTEDGQDYILLNEDDVIVLVTEDAAA